MTQKDEWNNQITLCTDKKIHIDEQKHRLQIVETYIHKRR
jgi:hypothetical protein